MEKRKNQPKSTPQFAALSFNLLAIMNKCDFMN